MSRRIAPPHNLWVVAKVNALALTGERRRQLIDWVAEVSGLARDEIEEYVQPTALVTQSGQDKSFRLHLSRYVRDDEGRMVVDHAADRMQSEPLVYPISEFPEWLPQASHQQGDS